MTTNKLDTQPDPPENVVTPGHAARMLESSLGESEVLWIMRLTNWRRPERQSPIPWRENKVGRPVYNFDDVLLFIDRRLAQSAAATHPGIGAGKVKATATPDMAGDEPFVRVFWAAGTAQGTFSLSTNAARNFATKLMQAAARSEDIGKTRTQ